MKGSNKVNKNTTGSTGPCKGCEDEKPINVVNQFVVEEIQKFWKNSLGYK